MCSVAVKLKAVSACVEGLRNSLAIFTPVFFFFSLSSFTTFFFSCRAIKHLRDSYNKVQDCIHIYIYIYIYSFFPLYIYIYICISACIRVYGTHNSPLCFSGLSFFFFCVYVCQHIPLPYSTVASLVEVVLRSALVFFFPGLLSFTSLNLELNELKLFFFFLYFQVMHNCELFMQHHHRHNNKKANSFFSPFPDNHPLKRPVALLRLARNNCCFLFLLVGKVWIGDFISPALPSLLYPARG